MAEPAPPPRRGPALTPRVPAGSVDELLAGATGRTSAVHGDGKSGAPIEQVEIDGTPHVLKHLHPDHDWTMRGYGDLACRPVRVWTSGILDALPPVIDHATVGAAWGLGRNGWGGALLMRDVGAQLIPEGDDRLHPADHGQLLDHLAELSVHFWEATDDLPELLPLENRWTTCNPTWLAAEAARGWPAAVPRIADRGWASFATRAPRDVRAVIDHLHHDPGPLVTAARATPQTLLHGDWKLGNLGVGDGRTVLLDWTYPGVGPVCHDLAWYLALNSARLPETKEESILALRGALVTRGVEVDPWWERQLDLCLLGALVQFGWEKALGDADELAWWCERAREGARWLA